MNPDLDTTGTIARAESALRSTEDEEAAEALRDLLGLYDWLKRQFMACSPGKHTAPQPEGDRLVDVEEAAEILGVTDRWLYDRSDELPFAKKLAPRTLRFSEREMRHWIETRP